MRFTYPHTKLLINGEWRDGAASRTIDVLDPATNKAIGTVARAEREDLEHVARSLADGFETWRAVAPFERTKIMVRAAALLRERCEKIAWIMTREQGKPLAQSTRETLLAADTIEWFAQEAKRAYGQVIPPRQDHMMQMTIRCPVGPVAAFTPWNFPINQVVRKLCGALAAGCSIVVKGPEQTPASPAALVEAFVDAGVPAGVIALVYGIPSEISEFFIPHPVIEKISFTGSTAVGKHLAGLAGTYMKKATMELGGHAPVVVCDDADVDEAATTLARLKILNAGQVCVSPTRFLVQDGIFNAFLEKFVAAMRQVRVGNGLDQDTDMGPLIHEGRLTVLGDLVNDAMARGAKLECGNTRIGVTGNFFAPTVLSHVPAQARIMNEEPFGPVAVINRFTTLAEAVAEANRLRFGLAAYAFTRSTVTAHILATQVNTGMMAINHGDLGLPEVPFGGIKDSGYGTEGGPAAINDYLDTKFVTLAAR